MADRYKVVKQQEVIDIGTAGTPERMLEITYETIPSEVTGTVRVPLEGLTAEKVHTALDEAATTREAIAGL